MFLFEWFGFLVTAPDKEWAAALLRKQLVDDRGDCPNDDGVYSLEQWVRENNEFEDERYNHVDALQYMRMVPPEEIIEIDFSEMIPHINNGKLVADVAWEAIPEILDHCGLTVHIECQEAVDLLNGDAVITPPWL